MICRLIFVATLMVWVFILTGCTESRTAIPADAAASHDGMDGGSGFPDLGGGPDLEQDLWSPNPDSSPDLYSPDQHIPDAMQPDSVQPDAMQPDVLPDDACSPQTFYLDGDGDGYGDSKKTTFACAPPKGYAKQGGDCDDTNKEIHPGAKEKCNKKDDNCNYFVDEGITQNIFYKDNDGDGYGSQATVKDCMAPTGFVSLTGDCNDNNAAINPGATEVCNEVDDNCNGFKDEGLTKKVYFKDNDGDGYGGPAWQQGCTQPKGYVANAGDCNDYNKMIHPYATEQCNGADDDCNGIKDDKIKLITIYKDNDGDGFAAKNALSQQN